MTLIDLERWKIVGSAHSASLDADEIEGDRILSNKWLALTWQDSESSRRNSTLDHRYELISLPDLAPGPVCTVKGARGTMEEVKKNWAGLNAQNDLACADVLKASMEDSMEALERRVTRGRGPQAPVFNTSLMGNSLFVTSSNTWYGVDSVHSELSIFDKDGQKERTQKIPHLLCESQPVQGPSWDCSCSIEGVSEEQKSLLVYCRTVHDNLFGSQDWLKQWLSVFRSDDLSEVGLIRMSRLNEETSEAIVTVEGHAYVLAVAIGETLRVYAVPDHP
jgi:hypothetical protein